MWIFILLATYYSTSSDSSLIAQSLYDGRDVCSSVPQSDDPLSVVSGQFCGHSYLWLSPTNTWTVFRCVTFQTEFDYVRMYTVQKFGIDLLCCSRNVVEEPGAASSKMIYKCHLITHMCILRVPFLHACTMHTTVRGLILSFTNVHNYCITGLCAGVSQWLPNWEMAWHVY